LSGYKVTFLGKLILTLFGAAVLLFALSGLSLIFGGGSENPGFASAPPAESGQPPESRAPSDSTQPPASKELPMESEQPPASKEPSPESEQPPESDQPSASEEPVAAPPSEGPEENATMPPVSTPRPEATGAPTAARITLRFEPGAYMLTDGQLKELSAFAAHVSPGQFAAVIESRSVSSEEGDSANLAAIRARAIRDALEGCGVPPENIRIYATEAPGGEPYAEVYWLDEGK